MITYIENTEAFSDFLIANIDRRDYRYKYLVTILDAIFSQQVIVDAGSFVNEENGGWILFIETEAQIFLYGNEYLDDQLNSLFDSVDLNLYEGFEIMGSRNLVYQLLGHYGIENYKLIKDRCFYALKDCDAIPKAEDIQLASKADIEELISMFQDYYVEEYNGERNKTAEFLRPMIERMIENENLVVIKAGADIATFCSIIDPDIGIIFTRKDYRGHKNGLRLMQYCSSLLYEKNGIAFVMTDMYNEASNKICQKIGYEPIYEHTNLKIEN